jgi:RNA polymerase sigma-70 factor, ECF subfamily
MTNFHDLFQTYAQDIHRFAYWLSGDVTEAEDITSETFVRAWTASDRLRTQTVKAYLLTIARHIYLQRRQQKSRQVVLDDDLPSHSPGPEQIAESRGELEAVLKALDTLPDLDRAVILMRAQNQFSYEEIAAACGISAASARVRVHRVRLKLASLRESPEKP